MMITICILSSLLLQDALDAGRAKLKKLDLEGAAADFEKAVEGDAKSAAAWTALGDARLRMGEWEKAEEALAKAIELEPTAERHAIRAISRMRRGKTKDAAADASAALKKDEKCALGMVAQAEVALSESDFQGADDLIRAALRIDAACAEGLYLRAILKSAQGNARGMLRDLERAAEADPLHLDARVLRATALADNQRVEDSLAEFEELLKIRPTSDSLYAMRGSVKWRAKDNEGAKADLSKAIELKPTEPGHWLRRADLHRSVLKDYEKAIADYTKCIELQPENTTALTGRGYAYCRAKDFKAAGKDMARAYELRVEDPWGAYNLACFHGLRAAELEGDDRKKAIDKAFEWVFEARKTGYIKGNCGCHGSNLEHLKTDSDLDPLHGDERWKKASAGEAD